MLHTDGIVMSFPIGPFRRMPAGGGTKFSPYFPLTQQFLEEYYDSRTPTVAHGQNVNPWLDLSGHARNMADDPGPTIPPTLNKTSGLSPNGVQLVHWDGIGGVTGMLLTTGTINPFPVATRGHTFYAYADWQNTLAPPAPFAGSVFWGTSLFNSCPRELINKSNATNLLQWRDSGGFHGTHAFLSGFHQVCYAYNPAGTVCSIYIDGVLIETIGYTFGANAADTTALSFSTNVPLKADMGHFVWYSNYHNAALVAKHALWASIFWGF